MADPEITQEMLDSYVNWEPPVQVDLSNAPRMLGLLRAAFFAGYQAAIAQQIEKDAWIADGWYMKSGRDYDVPACREIAAAIRAQKP